MTKRQAELLLLSVFLVMAVFLYWSTSAFPEVVQHSTAAYVRFLALCFGGLAILELFLWIKSRRTAEKKMLDLTSTPFRFWGLLISMLAYAMLLEPVGFYLASAIFLPVTMVILGARKKVRIALTSAGVLLFVYFVFARLLSVPLPQSIFS